MLRNTRISKRPKSRLASVEIQFAFMLIDICKTELCLGDLVQAERALAEARVSAEFIADMVQSRGIAPTVRAKLSRLARSIELVEGALSDAYDATLAGAHQPPTASPAETIVSIPIALGAASGR